MSDDRFKDQPEPPKDKPIPLRRYPLLPRKRENRGPYVTAEEIEEFMKQLERKR